MARPFAVWQSRFTRAAIEAPGFLALEIAPAFAGSSAWQITQRFRSQGLLDKWRYSPLRQQMFNELAPMREPGRRDPDEEATAATDPLSCVTEVITTIVEPGKEPLFQTWSQTLQASQAKFPGYMGVLVQAPVSAEMPYWTTLIRFAAPAQLDSWLVSPERQRLLRQADHKSVQWQSRRMLSPFAGWFPRTPDRTPPAAWKQTTLVLLVLFPVVMLEIEFLSPLLAGHHVAVATFIGNAISVSLVSWPLMKIAVFAMSWWLHPVPGRRWQIEALGVCTMAALYALELTIFTLLS